MDRPWGKALAAALTTALVLGGAAQARPFVILTNSANSWTLIDPAAIEVTPQGIRRAWVITVRRSILDGGPPQPGYVRTLNEYDCEGRTTRWRSLSVFSRTGSLLVSQENKSGGWLPVGDAGETFAALRMVCGESRRNSVISANAIGSVVIALMQNFDPSPAATAPPPTHAPKTP